MQTALWGQESWSQAGIYGRRHGQSRLLIRSKSIVGPELTDLGSKAELAGKQGPQKRCVHAKRTALAAQSHALPARSGFDIPLISRHIEAQATKSVNLGGQTNDSIASSVRNFAPQVGGARLLGVFKSIHLALHLLREGNSVDPMAGAAYL